MKVNIGKFTTWLGPFQLAEKILFWKDRHEDEVVHRFGHWLADNGMGGDSRLAKLCEWVNSKKKRKVSIKIDKWDTWNMDGTLALIILPMLKQLQATKHGAPFVDDEDVPLWVRSTSAPPKENEWDIDKYHFERWEWVMNELIWTFEQLQPDYDWEDLYRSGEHDVSFQPSKELGENGKPVHHVMVEGPRHTYKFDTAGYQIHENRIKDGLRLFGKYYQGLWD